MSQKKVTIAIETDGSTTVDSSGFTGNSCTLATREIELALAGNDPDNRDDKKKPDYYATTGNTQNLRN